MLKRFLKNERGLTLVELLAVVVILGIIAAIAVPSIGNIISKSERDAVHASGVQLLNAAKLAVASEGILDTDGDPANTRTYSSADTGNFTLGRFLDNPPNTYSIVVTKATTGAGTVTYTNITVSDTHVGGTTTRMWADTADLLDGNYDSGE